MLEPLVDPTVYCTVWLHIWWRAPIADSTISRPESTPEVRRHRCCIKSPTSETIGSKQTSMNTWRREPGTWCRASECARKFEIVSMGRYPNSFCYPPSDMHNRSFMYSGWGGPFPSQAQSGAPNRSNSLRVFRQSMFTRSGTAPAHRMACIG